MFLRPVLIAALAAVAVSGCSSIRSQHGFQVIEAKPAEVVVGTDTKSTVTERLGSPSVVSTFEPNIWFYVSSAMSRKAFFRPKVTAREVVAVSFDPASEKVTAVETYDIADGKVVQFAERETPTRGRQLSVLEQLLGNVGRAGNVFGGNEDERTPGGRRQGE